MANIHASVNAKRLFLALWPDALCREKMGGLSGQIGWLERAAVYAPQDWHVTLHFLGAVPADRIPAVEAAADIAVPPFSLSLDALWSWPGGLVVLGTGQVPCELVELHRQLGERLRSAGFKLDARPYRPHVTLARRAEGAVLPQHIEPITLTVDRFALVESTGDEAARYRCLRSFCAACKQQ